MSDTVIEEFVHLLTSGSYEPTFAYLDKLYDGGTDLANFAKDILLRLDEHFMDDPAHYATLAGLMREIYGEIKRYPYPILVYKSKLWKYFEQHSGDTTNN